MLPYPFFIPPAPVHGVDAKLWNEEQRKAYFDWMMFALEYRTKDILAFLRLDFGNQSHPEVLLSAGRKVSALLTADDQFTEEGRLSNRGFALIADIGLLTAKYIAEDCRSVRWIIKGPPPKSFGYNKPVLVGFGDMYLEPIGGSIGEAEGILSGERDHRAWFNIYRHWMNLARTHAKDL